MRLIPTPLCWHSTAAPKPCRHQTFQTKLGYCCTPPAAHSFQRLGAPEGQGDGARPPEGGLLGAEQVGEHAVRQADHHVHRRHGVREGEVVEDGLVQQVERHVQPVPHQHKRQRHHRRRRRRADYLADRAARRAQDASPPAAHSSAPCRPGRLPRPQALLEDTLKQSPCGPQSCAGYTVAPDLPGQPGTGQLLRSDMAVVQHGCQPERQATKQIRGC